jgi:hypothetical protein
MPPEEQEAMPRPELHAADEHTATTNHGPCSYSVETLMALQKLLEGGIPEHTRDLASPSALQSPTSTREARQSQIYSFCASFSNAMEGWKKSIKALFTQGKKSKSSSGKGNSAQQTG